MEQRNDLLLDDTVQEVLWRFDVDHAFPKDFVTEGKKNEKPGWLRATWDFVRNCLGFRRRDPSPRGDQQRDLQGGGEESGVHGSAGSFCRSDRQDWRAKPGTTSVDLHAGARD
jgi:hypothetical protein